MEYPYHADELHFFAAAPEAFEIYAAFSGRIRAAWPEVRVKVQKTQISFSGRYNFALAWLPRGRVRGQKDARLGVSFGLPARLDSPRIFQAVEPYPNRWTHHVLLSGPHQVDPELMGWVAEAYAFSACK